MVSFKHAFHSDKDDGTDSQLVRPSNWNDEHTVTVSTGGVVLGRPVGAGTGVVQEVPFDSIVTTVMPTGSVMAWAGAEGLPPPAGWYICDASLKSTTTDAALFAVCQYAYGGSGPNFALPDLRGRSICAPDLGQNRNPGAIRPGIAGGSNQSQAPFGGQTIEIGAEWFINDPNNSGNRNTSIPSAPDFNSAGGSGSTFPNQAHTHIFNVHGIAVGMSGALKIPLNQTTGLFNVIPPMITLNYIIKR